MATFGALKLNRQLEYSDLDNAVMERLCEPNQTPLKVINELTHSLHQVLHEAYPPEPAPAEDVPTEDVPRGTPAPGAAPGRAAPATSPATNAVAAAADDAGK